MACVTTLNRFGVFTKLRPVWYIPLARICRKINPVLKRGSMLSRLIENTCVENEWREAPSNKANHGRGVFANVSRPTRRRTVLNNLFIENITDVLATGSVAPEVAGMGIEINGVRVSYDFTVLNVFYTVPLSKASSSEYIADILAERAPQIRAELISRNVLGKVPHIYFLRDSTNALLSAFEEALASADTGPKSAIIPEMDFLKDLTKFDESRREIREQKEKERKEKGIEGKKKYVVDKKETVFPNVNEKISQNILGLNHDALMSKVIQMKKSNPLQQFIPSSGSDDLFSKIEGVPLDQNTIDRAEILKKFHVDRKVEMKKMKSACAREDTEETEDIPEISCNDDYKAEVDCFEKDEFDEVEIESVEDIKGQ